MQKKNNKKGVSNDSANPKKRVKNIKLALISLFVLFFLLLIGRGITIYASLNKPISSRLNATKSYTWQGDTSTNIIFAKTKNPKDVSIYVVNLDPKESKISILNVPPLIYAELPKGYGSWRIGSIYALGQENSPPVGADLLKLSLTKILGMPIDGIILTDKAKGKSMEDFIADMRKNRLNILATLTSIESDLTLPEVTRLFWKMSEVRADRISQLNLEQSSITESKLLPDTSRVLGLNSIKLDLLLRSNLADSSVLLEDKTVAVFNATDHPGLTRDAVRLITNLGARVIIISNTEIPESKSYVFIGSSDDKVSLTARRLTQIFASRCIKEECTTADRKITLSRAQINIVLGEDYYNYWYKH